MARITAAMPDTMAVAEATRAGMPVEAMEAAVETEPQVIPRLPTPVTRGRKALSLPVLVGTAVGLVIGGVAGFLGVRFGTHLLLPGLPKWIAIVHLAALPLVWLVVVGFHEFGHIVGGWAGGGKFLLYVVGPLMWKRTPAGVRFSWNKNLNIAGGLAACLPLDPAAATPRGTAIMVAGGPIFSLVLTVLAAWLGAGIAAIAVSPVAIFAQHLALFVAGMSLLIFLVTVAPGTAGGFKSDGLRFYELLRGGPRSEQENAVMTLTTAALGGVRPADYDPRLVEQAISLRDGSLFDLYAHHTVAHHFIDLGQPGRAQALLDHVMSGEAQLVPFARDALRCDYAWLLAEHSGDAVAARAWLDSAGALAFDPATRLRAEAAVLLAEGRRAEAAAKAREGLHALEHKSLSPTGNPFARDVLEDLLARAEA
ncbi:MAG: M50 family metallopeptidase [Opitutae bacterium]|nr:M50 family metallopeptidase [Opitutae bacterium]